MHREDKEKKYSTWIIAILSLMVIGTIMVSMKNRSMDNFWLIFTVVSYSVTVIAWFILNKK